ncbi:hypothetical protein [Candidatus Leptofilum sp.]|uniref:hypothetical protein n=1 Tax=Candidatus Leptofilum sp. TaxID=3241576 RepID=UPI003B591DAB
MIENDLNKGVGKPLIVAGLGDVGAQLDRCFLPLGLQPGSLFGGRKYFGEINGRSYEISIATRTRNRYVTGSISYRKFTGLWLSISVTTPVMSRLMLGQPRGLARRFVGFMQRFWGNRPVENVPTLVENFIAFAHDPAWLEDFLADTAVQSHLILLMNNPTLPPGAAVSFSPGKLNSLDSEAYVGRWQWSTPAMPNDFTPEAARQWVSALAHLAALAEKSPPGTAVQPTWLEKQNPRTAAFLMVSIFLFGIPLLLAACCILPALILIIISGI